MLDFVGLRNLNLSSDVASLTTGPSDMLDAYQLERQLNASITGPEWQIIANDFPDQFGLYTVFNASDFEGSIISIRNESGIEFDISLLRDMNSSDDALFVTLPGLSTFIVTIPTSVGLRDRENFQSLGVRLSHYQLVVLVDCELVDFVNLPEPPLPLPVMGAEVTVFDDQAIVS